MSHPEMDPEELYRRIQDLEAVFQNELPEDAQARRAEVEAMVADATPPMGIPRPTLPKAQRARHWSDMRPGTLEPMHGTAMLAVNLGGIMLTATLATPFMIESVLAVQEREVNYTPIGLVMGAGALVVNAGRHFYNQWRFR
jgi:hypothetical protein